MKRVAYGMKFQFKRCAFEHDFFLDHSFALSDAGMKGMEEKRKLRKCQLRGIIVCCVLNDIYNGYRVGVERKWNVIRCQTVEHQVLSCWFCHTTNTQSSHCCWALCDMTYYGRCHSPILHIQMYVDLYSCRDVEDAEQCKLKGNGSWRADNVRIICIYNTDK